MSAVIWPRPCLVDGERRAMCWGAYTCAWVHGASISIGGFPAGQESTPVLLVEYEDGSMEEAKPGHVQMLDSGKLFGQYCWER